MKKIAKNVLHVSVAIAIVAGISGCSVLKETLASQLEVPTLEKQVNRVALGMDIVRFNHLMAIKLKISGDAAWPKLIAKDLNKTEEKALGDILKKDSYYATIHYSEPIQRKMLGGSSLAKQVNGAVGFDAGAIAGAVADPISPLAYRAAQKAQVLYGNNPKQWPNLFSFEGGLKNFLEFKSGKLKMVEAGKSDAYDTLSVALIALTPTNFQKDLTLAKSDLDKTQAAAAELEGKKSELEGELKKNPSNTVSLKVQINELKPDIEKANATADEKEKIYFTMLDSAITAMQADVKLTNEQVALARNVHTASKEIESGATEAYGAFGIAIGNIATQPLLQNLPKELLSLVQTQAIFPQFADQIKDRIERLTKNSLYFLPNMGMGTYYAHKQSSLASKYKDITAIIVDTADVKEKADKEAAEEAAKKAKEAQEAANKA